MWKLRLWVCVSEALLVGEREKESLGDAFPLAIRVAVPDAFPLRNPATAPASALSMCVGEYERALGTPYPLATPAAAPTSVLSTRVGENEKA